jgi:hypothetical protein
LVLIWFQFIDEACHQIERNERNVRQTGILAYIPRYLTWWIGIKMRICIYIPYP